MQSAEVSKSYSDTTGSTGATPMVQGFAAAPGLRPERSNAEMARDFLDLEFRMESGRPLPTLTRFNGPITIGVGGAVPGTAAQDLSRLMARFRNEAGLDVRMVEPGQAAGITIDFHPRAELQRLVPSAACFVVPQVTSLADYRARRNSAYVDWAMLTSRKSVRIFVPSDTSPQEVRDCLHEELAQAMGPLNDLYRLPDSVFNDDNFHTVLTGFDMLMLRVHYAPELANGMNEAEVAARLPGILARINPAGQGGGVAQGLTSPRPWVDAVAPAFGLRAASGQRRAAVDRMVSVAKAQGWADTRMAFSYFAAGRLNVQSDPQAAVAAFAEAGRIYRGQTGTQIHAAHVDMQLAALALSAGQPEQAIQFADRAMPVVRRAENASLLATLMLIKAEGLEALGQSDAARALRMDSQPLARYGFGAEHQVKARMSEIAMLRARGQRG
ncbi:MAG: DUF2927 domain-containing protein [Paracoccaceae bacterium]